MFSVAWSREMDFVFWWTGLFCHVIFWGAMVLALGDKVWTSTMQVWMHLRKAKQARVSGLKYVWAVVKFWFQNLRQLIHDDSTIGGFSSCEIGGYELKRPFGIPRKVR